MANNYYLFRYLAIDSQGQLQTGYLLSLGKKQLLATLIPLQLQLLHARRTAYFPHYYWRTADKLAFLQQLAHYLQAGLTLSHSLTLLTEQQTQRGWRYLLQHFADRINNGERFSAILADYPAIFPAIYASLFYVAEETGHLEQCCSQLLKQQQQVHQLQQQIKHALRYPTFLLVAALLLCWLLLSLVIPQFADMYASFQQKLPMITQQLLRFSWHLQHNGASYALVGVALSLSYLVARNQSPSIKKVEQSLLFHLPIIQRLISQSVLNQIFLTLAIGQQSGLTTSQNLACAKQNCHYWRYQQALQSIIKQIEQGQTLSHALASQSCFPPLCKQLIQVGEQTGQLDTLFVQLANYYQQQTQQLSQHLPQLLEPILLLLIAGLISLMLFALYSPLFALGDLVGGL